MAPLHPTVPFRHTEPGGAAYASSVSVFVHATGRDIDSRCTRTKAENRGTLRSGRCSETTSFIRGQQHTAFPGRLDLPRRRQSDDQPSTLLCSRADAAPQRSFRATRLRFMRTPAIPSYESLEGRNSSSSVLLLRFRCCFVERVPRRFWKCLQETLGGWLGGLRLCSDG